MSSRFESTFLVLGELKENKFCSNFTGVCGIAGGCRVDYCRMWLTLDPDMPMPASDARRWVARSGPRSKHLSSTFEGILTHYETLLKLHQPSRHL